MLWKRLQGSQSPANHSQPSGSTETVLASYNALRGEIRGLLAAVPSKVLESLNSSNNQIKGKLAELVAYMDLRSQYDQLIPIGQTVDYIGVRFNKEDQPGEIAFIDIKNGPNSKLSRQQQELKKVLETGQVVFIKLKIDTDVTPIMSLDRGSDPVQPVPEEV